MSEFEVAAREWQAQDPDPETRAELGALLEAGDEAALADRFRARLEFGTAGLRGELGAGPNRMNSVTVMRAAAGLGARLLADGPDASVVIGFDARHKSERFARDTAAVLTGAGVTALIMPRTLPTPVLAFAVRHLGCAAGVMVTASHNPPRDNGYKVYWGDGGQIVPPLDAEISAAIDKVGRVDELPLGTGWTVLGEEIVEAYLAAVTRLPIGDARDLDVVYTAMHGVGGPTLLEAFERAGFRSPRPVRRQFEPDPEFSTVAFPNPEEPGAMDLALAAAGEAPTDLVIANDPDADRCAVAVPLPSGEFRRLSGDEVGGLLAEHVLRHTSGSDRLVVTTIVSSSLLGRMARHHGVRFAESLTGFKWIVRARGAGTGRPRDRFVFGYEEALGYCVGTDDGPPVRDKDGIGAALAIAGLAAEAKREGRTLLDLLDDQAKRYGLHATGQLSVRVEDLSLIADAMARLRATPPTELGGRPVTSVQDLAEGVDGLPPTDGLRYRLGDQARIVVRPSGTEPKLKCYLEVVVPVTGEVADARTEGAAALAAIGQDLSTALAIT